MRGDSIGRFWFILGGWACMVATPSTLFAHGLEVSARRVDGDIVVTAQYSGGGAVEDAAVTIFGDDETVFAEGRTDAAGEFAWSVAETPAYLRIEVDPGGGHKGTRICTRRDLADATEPIRRVSTWTVLVGIVAILGLTWALSAWARRRKTRAAPMDGTSV